MYASIFCSEQESKGTGELKGCLLDMGSVFTLSDPKGPQTVTPAPLG